MSLFDLSDIPGQDLMTGTYTVTRSAAGAYGTDGRFVAGSTSTFSITASVQPLDGRDLLRLPEGLRTSEVLKIYTKTRLFVQGAGQDPDSVAIDGVPHQIEMVETWGPAGNFYKAYARAVGRQAP